MALQTPPAAIHDPMAGWWPSRYGAEDEAGALNEITPGKVLGAIGLVRQGLVYDLAHVLHQDIPAFPGRPGDAVFFHTGHGGLWGTDNERYAAGEPGPGLALAGWLADHRVALTGCDTWSFGPYPPESPDAPFAVPQLLNVRHGVVVVENLRLAD